MKLDKFLSNGGYSQLADEVDDETLDALVSSCCIALTVGVKITWDDWCDMSPLTQAALGRAAMILRGEEEGEAQALRQMGMNGDGHGY